MTGSPEFAAVSIIDPPDVTPALAFSASTLSGGLVGDVISQRVARQLIREMQGASPAN